MHFLWTLVEVLAFRVSLFMWSVQVYVYHHEMKGELGEN